jgi:predicted Zn-dependent protease
MAWVQERNGNREEARRWLETAAAKEPFNFQIYDALAQLLMRGNEFEEARRLIAEVLERAPANVYWRERAIRLLVDCGDEAGAVAAAREGVRVYPRGAYMWCLLGATLQQHRRFAESGEIEESLRRSLALNQGLFDAADLLAMVLAEQKQYEEAAEVMKQILPRMGDASPARGRLAWIHRQQGKRAEARAEMAAAVRDTPGYAWGWLVLMEWLVEDSDWNLAGELLGEVRPELATQLQFRQQRLQVLERARLGTRELDEERRKLLADFPEEVPLHLECYDRWHDAKRLPEAYGALKAIQAVEPENPFLLARLAEMQLEEKQNEAALETLERLCFAEVESSAWPMDYAWAAVQKAKLEETAEARLRKKLEEGARPTLRGFFVLAAHLLERGGTNRLARQPHWRIWFPDRGARELLKMLEVAERMPWADGRYREIIFDQLSGHGYAALVIKHWKTNRAKVEAEVPSWAQVGRALSVLERKKELRELLADWRTRPGVGMWTVANYVGGFNPLRREHLREIAATCRDALNNLPHDHCARYLAHRAAEACALLGDLEGFRDVWERCRPYFTTRQSAEEWFHEQCTYLLEIIPEMGAYLEQGKEFAFRRKTWGLRLSRIARLQIQ